MDDKDPALWWLAWAGVLASTAGLMALIVSPALLKGTQWGWLGTMLMEAYSPFCHQDPARSFLVSGAPIAACARCTGLWAGAVAGIAAAPLAGLACRFDFPPRWVLGLGLAPMAVDVLADAIGLWPNTGASRAVTGMIAGTTTAGFLLPGIAAAAVEIADKVGSLRSMSGSDRGLGRAM